MKIFSDTQFLAPQTPHTIMLYPFWGINPDHLESNSQVYMRYAEQGQQFFELTGYEEARLLIAPAAWEKNDETRQLIQQFSAKATTQKPIVVFFWHDSDELLDLPNSTIFRTSFYKSMQKKNEFAMPSWSKDFAPDGNIIIREKQSKPVVGFCGYAITRRTDFVQYLKDIGRLFKDGVARTREKRQRRSYHVLRARALRLLQNSKCIQTNYVIRDRFFGHFENKAEVEREFLKNMQSSDYIVCVRGAGNFSYRLYETLSCGRIPIFINTDCVLPYDFIIDWKQYCVWIEVDEIGQIAEKVADFHAALSPSEFIDLQKRCRQFWEDFISPHGFFEHFHLHLNGAI